MKDLNSFIQENQERIKRAKENKERNPNDNGTSNVSIKIKNTLAENANNENTTQSVSSNLLIKNTNIRSINYSGMEARLLASCYVLTSLIGLTGEIITVDFKVNNNILKFPIFVETDTNNVYFALDKNFLLVIKKNVISLISDKINETINKLKSIKDFHHSKFYLLEKTFNSSDLMEYELK